MRSLLRDQAFAILTLPVRSEEEAKKLAGLTLGHGKRLALQPGGRRPGRIHRPTGRAGHPPTWITTAARWPRFTAWPTWSLCAGWAKGSPIPRAWPWPSSFRQAEALLRGFNIQAQSADRAVAEIEALWMGGRVRRPDILLQDLLHHGPVPGADQRPERFDPPGPGRPSTRPSRRSAARKILGDDADGENPGQDRQGDRGRVRSLCGPGGG